MYPTIQHLLESDTPSTPEEVAVWLSKVAKPWLEEIGKDLNRRVWRGTDSGKSDTYKMVTVRDDRKPLGMNRERQEFWDRYIKHNHRTALRSNSMLVTGNDDQADFFGWLTVAIPIGPFNYTWSPEVVDANDPMWNEIDHPVVNAFAQGDWENSKVRIKGDDNTLSEAIRMGNEIMIRPHSKQVVLLDPEFYDEMGQFLNEMIKR